MMGYTDNIFGEVKSNMEAIGGRLDDIECLVEKYRNEGKIKPDAAEAVIDRIVSLKQDL